MMKMKEIVNYAIPYLFVIRIPRNWSYTNVNLLDIIHLSSFISKYKAKHLDIPPLPIPKAL